MDTYNSRRLLFLVGMHRSGTSALSAALHACGASFGRGLLEPMEGVNDRGFWESAEVVELNEQLLSLADASWYSVTSFHVQFDWTSSRFDAERQKAERILRRGFGSAPLEVVKDPRFCITLPFWLALCKDIGLPTTVCVMTRAPAEVCRSLQDRDGFPIGYGMRLLRVYLSGIAASAPPDALYASYDRLLGDPVEMLRELEKALPIVVDEEKLIAAVVSEMKHQHARPDETLHEPQSTCRIDIELLDKQIKELYPIEDTLSNMSCTMVCRGKELTRIGEAHTRALQTLTERDSDIKKLSEDIAYAQSVIATRDAEREVFNQRLQHIGSLHTQALETIKERDGQLRDFDSRLQEIGELHSRALIVIEERDEQQRKFAQRFSEIESSHTKALHEIESKESKLIELIRLNSEMAAKLKENDAQLQRIFQKPGIGLLFRAMWKYETC